MATQWNQIKSAQVERISQGTSKEVHELNAEELEELIAPAVKKPIGG